jgi:hypothetical protein
MNGLVIIFAIIMVFAVGLKERYGGFSHITEKELTEYLFWRSK